MFGVQRKMERVWGKTGDVEKGEILQGTIGILLCEASLCLSLGTRWGWGPHLTCGHIMAERAADSGNGWAWWAWWSPDEEGSGYDVDRSQ